MPSLTSQLYGNFPPAVRQDAWGHLQINQVIMDVRQAEESDIDKCRL